MYISTLGGQISYLCYTMCNQMAFHLYELSYDWTPDLCCQKLYCTVDNWTSLSFWGQVQLLCQHLNYHLRSFWKYKNHCWTDKLLMFFVYGMFLTGYELSSTVLWIRIRIRKNPKLLAGSGSESRSVTWGYGSGSETGDALYQKSSVNHKNKQFYNYDIKKRTSKSNIFFKNYALKCHVNAFFIVDMVKERIFIVGSETGSLNFY
jgi:hypothetical protein